MIVRRYLPYYVERRLEKGEEYRELIKDDVKQGLGVVGKSGIIEVFDAETIEAYAEYVIFDGMNISEPIPLHLGATVNYEIGDGVHAEWIQIKAVNGWIKYRMHWVPGEYKQIIPLPEQVIPLPEQTIPLSLSSSSSLSKKI